MVVCSATTDTSRIVVWQAGGNMLSNTTYRRIAMELSDDLQRGYADRHQHHIDQWWGRGPGRGLAIGVGSAWPGDRRGS